MMKGDRLLFLALATMSEAAEAAGPDPIRISLGVRLAVGYASRFSKKDRKPFDDFWSTFREPLDGADLSDRAYARRHNARRCFHEICRAIGIEPNVFFQLEMADARDPGRKNRVNMANAVRAAAAERNQGSEQSRNARHCAIDKQSAYPNDKPQ